MNVTLLLPSTIKLLGIHVGYNAQVLEEKNYRGKINKIKQKKYCMGRTSVMKLSYPVVIETADILVMDF